jgi:hypothetical protein
MCRTETTFILNAIADNADYVILRAKSAVQQRNTFTSNVHRECRYQSESGRPAASRYGSRRRWPECDPLLPELTVGACTDKAVLRAGLGRTWVTAPSSAGGIEHTYPLLRQSV